MSSKFKNLNLGGGLLSDTSKNLATNNFQITYIPIEDIVPNEKNEGFSLDEIQELKLSIAEVGLQQNLVVKVYGEKYKILSGHRRFEALKQLVAEGNLKYQTVPCVVQDLSKITLPLDEDTKEIYALVTTNIENRKNTDADRFLQMQLLSYVYDKLKENGYAGIGKRREFLAERLGVSESTVKLMTQINNNINADFRNELLNNNVKFTVASEISKLDIKEQDQLYKNTTNVSDLSINEVKDFKQASDTKKEKKSVIDTLTHNSYIFGKSDFNKISNLIAFDKYTSANEPTTVVLDKKEYAKILTAQASIEKQLKQIEAVIEKAVNKYKK